MKPIKTMKDIWEKKMIKYHLRKKYNLEKDQKIIISHPPTKCDRYFYEGVLLQETKKCRKTCCRKTHMRWVPYLYEMSL